MSKYIKLEDAIRKYAEMIADEAYWEHGAGNGSPDKEDIDIAREYYSDLPTIEVSEDCISEFRDYQIEWLTGHCDLELEPVLEDLIVRFLKDTAEMFIKENAPSVVSTTEQSSMVGEWRNTIGGIYVCSNCKSSFTNIPKDGYWKPMWCYCPDCGAKMKG